LDAVSQEALPAQTTAGSNAEAVTAAAASFGAEAPRAHWISVDARVDPAGPPQRDLRGRQFLAHRRRLVRARPLAGRGRVSQNDEVTRLAVEDLAQSSEDVHVEALGLPGHQPPDLRL